MHVEYCLNIGLQCVLLTGKITCYGRFMRLPPNYSLIVLVSHWLQQIERSRGYITSLPTSTQIEVLERTIFNPLTGQIPEISHFHWLILKFEVQASPYLLNLTHYFMKVAILLSIWCYNTFLQKKRYSADVNALCFCANNFWKLYCLLSNFTASIRYIVHRKFPQN